MTELLDKAREKGWGTPGGRTYHTEFHKRLVLPVGSLFLCLLGMPLGLQAGPGRRAIGIPFGLTLYILYYLLFSMARNIATSSSLPVPLVMWTPNIIFAILAIVTIHRTAHDKQLLPEILQNGVDYIFRLVASTANGVYSIIFPYRAANGGRPPGPEPATQTPPKKRKLRGNVSLHIFHFPECDYYYGKNCSIEFKDVTVALQAGFEPCQFCRTIMENKLEDEN
jgi:lipopolysaccharide export system permease protein